MFEVILSILEVTSEIIELALDINEYRKNSKKKKGQNGRKDRK